MEQDYPILKPSLNYGAMIGIGLVASSLLFYLLNMQDSTINSLATYLILAIGVFYAHHHFKANVSQGILPYGKALGLGTLTCLAAGIIFGFYTYVFLAFVDSSIIDMAMQQAYTEMENSGLEEEQINQAMEMTSMMLTPGIMGFFAFLGTAFFGFIESLIISIFTKKDQEFFQ